MPIGEGLIGEGEIGGLGGGGIGETDDIESTFTLYSLPASDDSIVEVFSFSAAVSQDGVLDLMDTVEFSTQLMHSDALTDTLELLDEQEEYRFFPLSDTVEVSARQQEVREQHLVDTLQLSDVQQASTGQSVEDTIEFSDEALDFVGALIEDTVAFSDAREVAGVSTTELVDTFSVQDAVSAGGEAEVESVVTFSDATDGQTDTLLEDTISFSASLLSTGALSSVVEDTIELSDAQEVFAQTNDTVSDTFTLRDSLHHKLPGAIAWVMNTETAAPSWYSNWQFVDMVQVGNRVLAVGPEGLVELGAATDNGDDIDAGVTYGFSDFGSDFKKRIDSFWFGYTSDDVLEASVETLGNPVYTYSMTPRDAEQPRNNRIRPGKGLNARYWRIGINNVGGCDFDVDSIAADVVQSARRL